MARPGMVVASPAARQCRNRTQETAMKSPPPRRASNRRSRLRVEALETRLAPAVAFSYNPLFGPDQVAAYNNTEVLDRPNLYLTFNGAYWNGTGATDRDSMIAAVKSIIGGPYLSALNQYEAPGQ